MYLQDHTRMKSIPGKSILKKAVEENMTVMDIYRHIYVRGPVKFNIVDGKEVVMRKKNKAQWINLQRDDRGVVRTVARGDKDIEDDKYVIEEFYNDCDDEIPYDFVDFDEMVDDFYEQFEVDDEYEY